MNAHGDPMERFLALAPGWRSPFDERANEWAELPYVAAGGLAAAAVEMLGSRPAMVREFFNAVEQMIGGDRETRHFAVVGLLEALQNVSLAKGHPLTAWESYLAPATQPFWLALVGLWEGKLTSEAFNSMIEKGSP